HGVRDRDQVIVVNPDQIIILDDLFELGGEMIVDPEIAAEVAARKLCQVQPIMENRPQHPIGETVIVFLELVLRQVGDDVFDVLVSDGSRPQLLLRANLSAPSDPNAAIALQRRPQRHFEPASTQPTSALGPVTGGNRNAIGNYRQARQYIASDFTT